MANLQINEDCLAPQHNVTLKYSGPDPWKVVKKLDDSIKPFFHVSSSGICHSRINWDITGDHNEFFSTWWAKKSFTDWTTMWVYIKVQGKEHKQTKQGEFSLDMTSELETKVEGWGIFLKPLWNIYSYLFYDRQRREYLLKCGNILKNFANEIKETFGLATTKVGTQG